jgi:hypothetical protein
MKKDLLWWKQFLQVFNGRRAIEYQVPEVHYVFVDACNTGGGCYYRGDWRYVVWRQDLPHFVNAHINVKEAVMMVVAAEHWGPLWYNGQVIVRIDNYTAASGVNKGTSRCEPLMEIVRRLFWLSVFGAFDIKCWFLPGTENWLADAVSRLHEPGKLDILCNWFNWTDPGFLLCWPLVLLQHMSYNAFLFVVPQVLRWINLGRSGSSLY